MKFIYTTALSLAALFAAASADTCTFHGDSANVSYGFNFDVVHPDGGDCEGTIGNFEQCLRNAAVPLNDATWHCDQYYAGKGMSGSFNIAVPIGGADVSPNVEKCFKADWGVSIDCTPN